MVSDPIVTSAGRICASLATALLLAACPPPRPHSASTKPEVSTTVGGNEGSTREVGPEVESKTEVVESKTDVVESKTEVVVPGTEPPPPAHPAAAWDRQPEGRAWTDITHQAIEELGAALLTAVPEDIHDYCPRYAELGAAERRAFWVHVISVLARFESNYQPSVQYKESFADSKGESVISRGLLQISKESANGYGCKIGDAQELHDPTVNLRCGVRILARWIPKDQVIARQTGGKWKGAARYWSPFRRDQSRETIARESAAQSYCSAPP